MVAQPQDGDSKSDVPAADSKTGGLFDLKGLPNWLKAIGYAVTLAVTAYPIYLGIATLQEKRAESLREAAREEQRRNDEEVRKKKMDLDAAQASEREAALRLDIVKEEGRDKLAVAQQEAQDR